METSETESTPKQPDPPLAGAIDRSKAMSAGVVPKRKVGGNMLLPRMGETLRLFSEWKERRKNDPKPKDERERNHENLKK